MGQKKGYTGNPNGRPKGVPNKDTKELREAMRSLLDNNTVNLELWLNQVAEENPQKALELFLKVAEYSIPKMRAVEVKTEFENLSDEDLDRIIKELQQ